MAGASFSGMPQRNSDEIRVIQFLLFMLMRLTNQSGPFL